MPYTNSLGQPIGFPLPCWQPCSPPPRTPMFGRTCRLEPLSGAHLSDLYVAYSDDREGRIWTYLPCGPLESGKPAGISSYIRIDPKVGSIEIAQVHFSPRLQRTVAATEAMYLMMARVFDELGYRRYEWKCDNANAKSRAAAARLGFTFEGIFRQCTIYKGRNRDTAWFSILDSEWPSLKTAFQTWLDPDNFDADGKQRRSLSRLTAMARERL
jgi:RimJ/RimL family protein N-acetyltransferase